jgi:hypothetical protein
VTGVELAKAGNPMFLGLFSSSLVACPPMTQAPHPRHNQAPAIWLIVYRVFFLFDVGLGAPKGRKP